MNYIEKTQYVVEQTGNSMYWLWNDMIDLKRGCGCVYIMQLGDTNLFKIGYSNDVDRRRAQIQAKCPIPITVIYERWGHDYRFFERVLHKEFEKKRVKGEWFKLSASDLMTIQNKYTDHTTNLIITDKN